MPIKKMTDGDAQRIGLVKLGTIFKGAPKRTVNSKKTGKPIQIAGEDLDYFRVQFELENVKEPGEEDRLRLQMYRNEWELCYGATPRRFEDVKLCGTTPDNATMSWFESWDAAGLKIRCDHETQQRYWNTTTQRYDQTPRACFQGNQPPCDCKQVMRIPLLLLNFSAAIGEIGYFMLVTHSVNDIMNIYSALTRFYAWSGNLSQITFVLERTPTELNYVNADGQRSKISKALISISANAQFVQRTLLPDNVQPIDGQRVLDEPTRAALPPPTKRIDQPPVANSLALRNMKVRAAFLIQAKAQYQLTTDAILDKLREELGVTDFNTDVDWYQACEVLNIEMQPPSTLLEQVK